MSGVSIFKDTAGVSRMQTSLYYIPRLKSLLVLRNFSTARKSGNIITYRNIFSSDTRQSMKRRIATERLTKIYIARCGYTLLDVSNWPQEWPISPITIVYLKNQSEKIFLFTQDWVLSLDINRFQNT